MYKMDQQVVSKGSKLVAIIYWGLALLVSPIAIGGLLSFPNQAAAIGLVFLLISLFFLWAGFRQRGTMANEDHRLARTGQQIQCGGHVQVAGARTVHAVDV